MKVPKARKLSSGTWFIQLRLGGESVSVTANTEKECTRKAAAIKADYQAGKKLPEKKKESMKLSEAIAEYISLKEAVLSPLTIRGYDRISKNRFHGIMSVDVETLAEYTKDEWQKVVNEEAEDISPKTLKNSFAFIKTVVEHFSRRKIDSPTLPQVVPNDTPFLEPEEIPIFVKDCVGRPQSVSLLLCLSSMRISEIDALDWKDIPENPDFIKVRGARVRDKNNNWVVKKTTKNETSTRNVPILIPELKEEIERCRKPSGKVLSCSQNNLRLCLSRICARTGITKVPLHGLRHSFASLCYHLQVPKKICKEIGGWKDDKTMDKIYTHIAQSDIKRYKKEIANFYEKQNANQNAN